jgi:hypothetical protein
MRGNGGACGGLNVQRPTLNVQRSKQRDRAIRRSGFVESWMLKVERWTFSPPQTFLDSIPRTPNQDAAISGMSQISVEAAAGFGLKRRA